MFSEQKLNAKERNTVKYFERNCSRKSRPHRRSWINLTNQRESENKQTFFISYISVQRVKCDYSKVSGPIDRHDTAIACKQDMES